MSGRARAGAPARRKGDLFFAICFAFFLFSSVFSDGLYALGWVESGFDESAPVQIGQGAKPVGGSSDDG